MWGMIVSPSLTFGDTSVPLRPEDVSEHEHFLARHMKAALGLPPQAHHSDLLVALGVPIIQEILRDAVLRGSVMRSNLSTGSL